MEQDDGEDRQPSHAVNVAAMRVRWNWRRRWRREAHFSRNVDHDESHRSAHWLRPTRALRRRRHDKSFFDANLCLREWLSVWRTSSELLRVLVTPGHALHLFVAPLCASAVASMFAPLGALPPSQLLMLQTLILCGIVTRTTLSSA